MAFVTWVKGKQLKHMDLASKVSGLKVLKEGCEGRVGTLGLDTGL